MNRTKGFFSLLLAGLIFGSFGVWVRVLNRELTTYQQIAARDIVASILAIAIAFFLKQKWSLNGVKKRYVLLFTLFFQLDVIFYVLAFLRTKMTVAIFSFYAGTIIFSLMFGIMFFREKINKTKLTSLILTFIGLGFFCYPFSPSAFNLGFIFAVAGGAFDAATNASRKFLSGKIDKFILVSFQMLSGVLAMAFIILFTKQSFTPHISLISVFIILLFGLLLMLVHFLCTVGFQNFDLNLGTIVMSSEMIFTVIFGMIAFAEFPTLLEVIGGIFISLSIVISNLKLTRRARFWLSILR
jgi:drug/metabolite transporter (DMT)-like permease